MCTSFDPTAKFDNHIQKRENQMEINAKMVGGIISLPSTILLLLCILQIIFQKTQGIVVKRLEPRASNTIQKLCQQLELNMKVGKSRG